jgi:hypothetical protein
MARLRAPLFAALTFTLASCNSTDSLTPNNTTESDVIDDGSAIETADVADFSSSRFSGGIPFGTTGHPNVALGADYNGALRIIGPKWLLRDLAAIRARGGRVVLNLAGGQPRFTDRKGHFSLSMWKASVDRFKHINFSSYINDGTIVGHYLLDEPTDKSNWRGTAVSQATVDEMARYSKQRWPRMATIVRAEPAQIKWSKRYRYLDAAWAQYVYRKGNATDFIRRNISDAQRMGLGLVVGLNFLKGGPRGRRLTASEITSWGSTLLNTSYPCAFISWQYTASYLKNSSIKRAMNVLRAKARNRGARSCRG